MSSGCRHLPWVLVVAFAFGHGARGQEVQGPSDKGKPPRTDVYGDPLPPGASDEARRRVEALLARPRQLRNSEVLRSFRALEVLDQIGTPEAQAVLQELAEGAPEAHLTREARASLARLAGRPRPG